MKKLSHLDESGQIRMVDVSEKAITRRLARASGKVSMHPDTVRQIRDRQTPKGDPLETARLAGIMAGKQTASLIPLCHPLTIEHLDVSAELVDDGVLLSSQVVVTGKTGAEMEALTAVSGAALVIYDMCKAVDREMIIGEIRLDAKSGGKSGPYTRTDNT